MTGPARTVDHVAGILTGWAGVPGATPEPSPGSDTLDPASVTPGVLGFLVIFAVVLACIPLFLSMTGKLRRVEHRARAEGVDGTGAAPGGTGAAPGGTGAAPGGPAVPDGPAPQGTRAE